MDPLSVLAGLGILVVAAIVIKFIQWLDIGF